MNKDDWQFIKLNEIRISLGFVLASLGLFLFCLNLGIKLNNLNTMLQIYPVGIILFILLEFIGTYIDNFKRYSQFKGNKTSEDKG